jgi:hypothetical protein
MEKRKFLTLPGLELRPIASRCTNYTILAQRFVEVAVKSFGVQDIRIFFKKVNFGTELIFGVFPSFFNFNFFQNSRRWTGPNSPTPLLPCRRPCEASVDLG